MFIYLAGPYSHTNQAIAHARFCVHEDAAVVMMLSGDVVFSPIMHWHRVSMERGIDTTPDFWEDYNQKMVSACSLLRVLDLPGLEESRGTAAEIGWASMRKIPVEIYSPHDLEAYKHFEKTLCG